jgi:hypothetical protein
MRRQIQALIKSLESMVHFRNDYIFQKRTRKTSM